MSHAIALAGTLTYVPPASTSAVALPLAISGTYNAQNLGAIDIPAATDDATVFDIPFGSVASPTAFFVKNTNTEFDVGIRFNGAVADEFQLAPGSMMLYVAPGLAADNELTEIAIVTTGLQVAAAEVQYGVFGD